MTPRPSLPWDSVVFCEGGTAEVADRSRPRQGLGFVVRGDKMKTFREPLGFQKPERLSQDVSLGGRFFREGPPVSVVAGKNILWNRFSCQEAGLCGRCEELCPTGVLDLGEFPGGSIDGSVCIRCRLCLHVCPTGALSLLPLDASVLPRTGSVSESFV